MSTRPVVLLARRSIRARIGRLIAIAVAIVIGVAFVVGSFVLADSLRSGFNSLFTDVNSYTDLQVRSKLAFGETTDQGAGRDPLAADLLTTVQNTPGVESAEGYVEGQVAIITPDGKAIETGGAPVLALSWDGTAGAEQDSPITLIEGGAPSGDSETALDQATASKSDIEVGDKVTVISTTGPRQFTVSGLVGLGDTDGFGGAAAALFELPTAQQLFGLTDQYSSIDVQLAEGTDRDAVQAALTSELPESTEVVTQETLNDEARDMINTFVGPLSTGLLIFAFITAFVSAFLINNVFAITIGQRLRELALLRAVGGGGRQVRRLIVSEALIVSIIATVVGVGAGIGVARLMLALFNAAGAGFPSMPLVLKPLAVIMAFLVGVGITLAAVVIPARRAAKIPPIAAMRPELGFESLSQRRLFVGTTVVLLGALLFLLGLFARPGGTPGLIFFAGGGALMIFLGLASVASTIARPATRLIGWPIAKLYKAPGRLARENAGRAPKRTSATAAALMIGVALVSAASVFAASIRTTFEAAFNRGVVADYVVTPEGFAGLTTDIATQLSELPELSAVSGLRFAKAQVAVDGGTPEVKDFGVADAASVDQLISLGMVEGAEADLANGILVNSDPAKDLDLQVGDELTVTFQNGTSATVPVAGIYDDAALAGNWLMSQELLTSSVGSAQTDFFVAIKVADGVSDEAAVAAMDTVLAEHPQAELKTADEWKKESAAQIDQLLVIITVLLAFAIAIAVLGISITLGLAVFERTREIGLMRAVGMTKRQTRKMVRWESVIVSIFGAVLGVVVGSLIGIALSMAVPDSIIETVSFSVGTVVVILIGAILAGLLAGLYPSYKASNMNVLEAIATE